MKMNTVARKTKPLAAAEQSSDQPVVADAGVDEQPPLGSREIDRLFSALGRPGLPERTRKLAAAKLPKKAKKLVEEATEVAVDALVGNHRGIVNESVDVLYHLVVLWHACGIKPDAVWTEMNRRANALGVSEKLPKAGKVEKKKDTKPAGEEKRK